MSKLRDPYLGLLISIFFASAACGDDDALGRDRDAAIDGGLEEDAEPTPSGLDAGALDAADVEADSGHDAGLGDPVTLRFRGKVGAHDYGCDRSYPDQGSAKTRVSGRAFRFFASDFRLIGADGSEVPVSLEERPGQNSELALLDFQNPDGKCGAGAPSNTTVTGRVPPGDYRGLKFTVGVPESLNHGDPALSPPPLRGSGMSWNWLQGYRFLIAELAAEVMDAGASTDAGMPVSDGAADGALAEAGTSSSGGGHMGGGGGSGAHASEPGLGLLHTGSTGCIGSVETTITCSKQNRALITLSEFDPSSDVISADVGAIFAAVDLARGLQCHGRGDECAAMFKALGVDLASGEPAAMQSVFRVE